MIVYWKKTCFFIGLGISNAALALEPSLQGRHPEKHKQFRCLTYDMQLIKKRLYSYSEASIERQEERMGNFLYVKHAFIKNWLDRGYALRFFKTRRRYLLNTQEGDLSEKGQACIFRELKKGPQKHPKYRRPDVLRYIFKHNVQGDKVENLIFPQENKMFQYFEHVKPQRLSGLYGLRHNAGFWKEASKSLEVMGLGAKKEGLSQSLNYFRTASFYGLFESGSHRFWFNTWIPVQMQETFFSNVLLDTLFQCRWDKLKSLFLFNANFKGKPLRKLLKGMLVLENLAIHSHKKIELEGCTSCSLTFLSLSGNVFGKELDIESIQSMHFPQLRTFLLYMTEKLFQQVIIADPEGQSIFKALFSLSFFCCKVL